MLTLLKLATKFCCSQGIMTKKKKRLSREWSNFWWIFGRFFPKSNNFEKYLGKLNCNFHCIDFIKDKQIHNARIKTQNSHFMKCNNNAF